MTSVPAVEGWFTTDPEPALIGARCTSCHTVHFPKAVSLCRNPGCRGTEFGETALSRQGKLWSFTVNRYAPPPPYVSPTDPFEPFGVAAVELAGERMIVLGQIPRDVDTDTLRVGTDMELSVEALDGNVVVWMWRPA